MATVAAVPCPRQTRLGTPVCPGTIQPSVPPRGRIGMYSCGHCRYLYSEQEVEAIRRAMARRASPVKPSKLVQGELL